MENNVTNFCLKSQVDGLMLHGLIVKPTQAPKAILQFVHGMAEHKERYLDVMQFFANQGFVCIIHDHRGHGESVLNKNDLGYFYDGDFAIVEDVKQVHTYMKDLYPNLKVFLLGHSMGSLIVRVFTKYYDHCIDGLIVSGSPSENPATHLGAILVKIMMKMKGDRYRSKWIDDITFAGYQKGFNQAKGKFVWLCSDDAVVKAYEDDELCGFLFTLNGFARLYYLMIETYNTKNWQVHNKKLPILFIAGEKDPCIQNSKKFQSAISKMKEVGYENVMAKLYPNMHHEILNEQQHMLVYQDILAWIEKLL